MPAFCCYCYLDVFCNSSLNPAVCMQYISVHMLFHYSCQHWRKMPLSWWNCISTCCCRQCQHCSILLLSLIKNEGLSKYSVHSKYVMTHYLALLLGWYSFIMITPSVSRHRRLSSWQMRMIRWSQCGLLCGVALWYLKKSMRDVSVVSLLYLENHRSVLSNSLGKYFLSNESNVLCNAHFISLYLFIFILCNYTMQYVRKFLNVCLFSGDCWHRESFHLWLCIWSYCWTRRSLQYGCVLLTEWAFQR